MHGLHKLLLFHVLTCLGQNALGGEIINGEKVPENSMLYMASVQKRSHHCGGFLVSEDFVVTAAHCKDPEEVVLGTHNLNKPGIVIGIDKVCRHPNYTNSVINGNDIMLLKLSRKVKLREGVQFMELPSSNMAIRDDEMCSVAGWGFTKTACGNVHELRVVKVPIVNLEECKSQWASDHDYLPAKVICAGGYDTKGFCQGDSGGPLLCNGKLVGVVSFNHRGICDYPERPNVYTDIREFSPWINNIIKTKNC